VPGQPGRVDGGHHQPPPPVGTPAAELGVGLPTRPRGARHGTPLDAPPPARPTRAAPAQLAGRLDRGMGRLRRRPGALAGLERQHERDLGRGQGLGRPGLSPSKQSATTVPNPMPACWAAPISSTGQLRLGLEPGVPLAGWQPRGRRVGHRMHRPRAAFIGSQAGHGHDAVVDLADPAQVLAGHVRGGGASLRSPVSSITSAPASCGAVAGSWHHHSTRRWLTCWWSQAASDRNPCSRWTSRCWAPLIGSAPASPVKVLVRSLGSSRPCR